MPMRVSLRYHRMKAVGLAQKDMLEFPVRQAEIADALGLSTVHVNRTVKSLSHDRLISYRNQSITILNWQALQTVGQFDPAYLHSPDGGSPLETRWSRFIVHSTRQRRLMGFAAYWRWKSRALRYRPRVSRERCAICGPEICIAASCLLFLVSNFAQTQDELGVKSIWTRKFRPGDWR
jgi:hypothetical protein